MLAPAPAGALTVGGASFAAPTASPPDRTQTGCTVTCSYASIGGEQTFTVPAGVSTVQVTAIGGADGTKSNVASGAGDEGALAAGVLTGLSGGTMLYLQVGGSVDSSDAFGLAQPGVALPDDPQGQEAGDLVVSLIG